MKKLLALALVLGISGIASAGLLLAEYEVTAPGQASISLSVPDGMNISAYKLGLVWDDPAVVMDEAVLAAVAFPTVFDSPGKVQNFLPPNYAEITAGQFLSPAVAGPAVLMDNLVIDFSGAGSPTLTFISLGGTTIDGAAIAREEIVRA